MLHIKEGNLVEKSVAINKASQTLHIKLDDDTYFEGIALFVVFKSNGHTLTLSCAQMGRAEFHCKLDVSKEMLSTDATLHCVLHYFGNTQETQKIAALLNIPKIKLDLDTIRDTGYASLKAELNALSEKINLLTGGGVHNVLPKEFKKELLTKGSVWTVIDNQGNCAFVQPFITNIEEINGIRSVGRSVTLHAEHIKTTDGNVQEVADRVAEFDDIKARLETIERHLFGDEGLR